MNARKRGARKSRAGGARTPRSRDARAARPARTRAPGSSLDRRISTPEDVQAARAVLSRAIRRLNLLETLLMGAAMILALVGGWLGALLARSALGLPLRTTWMVLSVLLFVVPAALAWTMERRKRRQARTEADAEARDTPTGGHDG